MFDPIIIRSQSGDVIEASVHEKGIKFNISKVPIKQHNQPSHKDLVVQMKAKNPTATDAEIEAAVDAQEAKAARTQPNLSPELVTSFSLTWLEWEKLTEVLKAIKI